MENPEETNKYENPSETEPPALATTKQNGQRQWIQFTAGFLGWFIIYGLIWWKMVPIELPGAVFWYDLCLLPINMILMIVLAVSKKTRLIGLGILAAMAVNLIIALLMGVGLDAIFNVPFFAIE